MQGHAHFFNRDVTVYKSSLTFGILFHKQAMKDNLDHIPDREAFFHRVLQRMGTNCIVPILHLRTNGFEVEGSSMITVFHSRLAAKVWSYHSILAP
jgi:hypothetical protein